MKTLVITISCLAIGTLSALAGSCGSGCGGDKDKKGDKGKEQPKESAITHVIGA
jgi:hypothetical protein